jgi:hypothetical protein
MTTTRTENQRWTVDRGDRKPSVDVFLAGLHHRGRFEREIYVHWLDASSPLTSAEARQVARALMAAADAVTDMDEE